TGSTGFDSPPQLQSFFRPHTPFDRPAVGTIGRADVGGTSIMPKFECSLAWEVGRHKLSDEPTSRTIVIREEIEKTIEAVDRHGACSAFADEIGQLPDDVDGVPVWPCESCGAAIIDGDECGIGMDG